MAATSIETECRESERRLLAQGTALIALTQRSLVNCGEVSGALKDIVETAARTLDVDRVSIWMYNASHDGIHCVALYELGANRHSSGLVLKEADYPEYFRALAHTNVIAADDAVTDERTSEFAESYLRPLGITSMMDSPLHCAGQFAGVLCHEHVGPPRRWKADELSFALSVANVASLVVETSARRRAESTLALQGAALNAAGDAVAITDRDGTVVWVNPAYEQMTGYSLDEAIGRNHRDLTRSGVQDTAFYKKLWTTLLDGRTWRSDIVNRRKDGTQYFEKQTITPVRSEAGEITHFVAIKRDLTEDRKLSAKFLQAQKMEVVGRLASGIAHDFNNLLTVINGTAELALTDLPEGHPLRKDFEVIQQSGHSAAALTRRILSFSRKQVITREPLDLGKVISDFRSMLQRLIGEDVVLSVESDESLCLVSTDVGHVEQLVLNLAINAKDAMPTGGQLTIETRNVDLDDRFVVAHPGSRLGRHLLLRVSDNGTGMDAATLARVFEPFFTTKGAGKGTGLGLATVYDITEQSGGTVWATSEPGKGSQFSVYLPCTTVAASAP